MLNAGDTRIGNSWHLDSGNSEVGRQARKQVIITDNAGHSDGDVGTEGTVGTRRKGAP